MTFLPVGKAKLSPLGKASLSTAAPKLEDPVMVFLALLGDSLDGVEIISPIRVGGLKLDDVSLA